MASQTRVALAEQRALAEILFDSIGDGAITTDEYGCITRINPIALNILGFSEEEVIGVWLPKLLSAYDDNGRNIPLIERPITRAFVTRQILSQRVRYKRKNGTLVPVSVTVSPIFVKDQPVGCIQIFRDITKEYEIDKMKSDFISLASHQLRTPLSAIKTYSHMLLDGFMGPLTKAQAKSLRTIVSATGRMNETISTLLNISRIESGSIAVDKKPINAAQLMDEIINEHQLAATDKKIKLITQHPDLQLKVLSDGVILKEILGNLVSNAIKYTNPNGQVCFAVKTKNNRVILSVNDTGMGIPKESRDNVFSKFYRGENVIRKETSGTGLGLYLVKGLVSELGGEVWFDSTEGRGSTFYVSLPLFPQTIRTQTVKK